jgi:NAD(P) transhydrogenase
MAAKDYDLIVIGSGPAGEKGAAQAAYFGKRVALVERESVVGGACVNTGTIPSKTLREAVVYLTGINQRAFYGQSYRVKHDITIEDLLATSRHVVAGEVEVIRSQFGRNHVRVIQGQGSFIDPHTLLVAGDGADRRITGEFIVIAVGTDPARPPDVAFDDRTVIDSDGLLGMRKIPTSMVVVGGGVIGVEYASMFAALGVKVTLIEQRDRILDFCDAEIVEGLRYHLRETGVTLRIGERVAGVDVNDGGTLTRLASGKKIVADSVLYSAGRQGAVGGLRLDAIGLEADERGRISVDEKFRTAVDNVYAVGDVIGFPSLAASSMEQGRLAACHAFGIATSSTKGLLPIGIYAIPEISYIGRTEEELTDAEIPYEVGISRYRELARGQILGDMHGMLKLIVSSVDRTLLGVHALGTNATEIVHIGQAVMAHGGTVDYLIDTVFNYPTLAESYKVAALDASNKLRAVTGFST